MTPFYHNPPSPLPLDEERNEDTDHPLFSSTSLTSSSTCPIYFKAIQDQGDYGEDQPPPPAQHHKHEVEEYNFFPSSFPTVDDHYYNSNSNSSSSINSIKVSNCKQDDRDGDPCDNGPVKWMSSKMRLMKKMMNSDRTVTSKLIGDSQICPDEQQLQDFVNGKNKNSTNNAIRVCSDCNTTKTPLWRSGPRGPKSLCNACGIRQRKARRALAAAANGGLVPSSDQSKKSKVPKEKRSDGDHTKQCKKICKLGVPRTKKQLRFDEFTISLSKNLAFHQVFPQDEKEAAILLMALSCGLVRG